MKEINVVIVNQKVISSNIFLSKDLPKKLNITMECRAKMKTPKDENDRNVFLNVELNLLSKDGRLKIELVSDILFELDSLPDDYGKFAEQKLVPMARESLLNSLDDILVVMGYKKMGLAKKM